MVKGDRVTLLPKQIKHGTVADAGPEITEVRWDDGSWDNVPNHWLGPSMMDTIPGDRMVNGNQPRRSNTSTTRARGARINGNSNRKRPASSIADDISKVLMEYGPTEIKAIAIANGVWKDDYDLLPNDGLRRMTVGNRLRARAKRGETIVT